LRVEEVKTIPLDGYWAMLNTGMLGGEGIPSYVILFFSIAEKNNWEWEIRENNRGG
jgi:hypothetical protein